MFGDSFMFGVRNVMAENFRRAVFVNPWLTEAELPPFPRRSTIFPYRLSNQKSRILSSMNAGKGPFCSVPKSGRKLLICHRPVSRLGRRALAQE